jgi:hypothetical protein
LTTILDAADQVTDRQRDDLAADVDDDAEREEDVVVLGFLSAVRGDARVDEGAVVGFRGEDALGDVESWTEMTWCVRTLRGRMLTYCVVLRCDLISTRKLLG